MEYSLSVVILSEYNLMIQFIFLHKQNIIILYFFDRKATEFFIKR